MYIAYHSGEDATGQKSDAMGGPTLQAKLAGEKSSTKINLLLERPGWASTPGNLGSVDPKGWLFVPPLREQP